MFGPFLGTPPSHYDPDEPRDWHGRWTPGGSASSWRNTPLHDPSPVGRARTFLGHALAGAWQLGLIRTVAYPTQAEGKRFSRLLSVWTMAAGLDDESFAEHFARGLVDDPKMLHRLRQAVAAATQAQTIGQMIEASYPVTAAIRAIGADRWPAVLERLEDRADAALPMASAPVTADTSWIGDIGQKIWGAINPIGTAYAQRRGSEPGELTFDEQLRQSQYEELQEEFSKNGLTYTVVTRPGSIPSWRDITNMRNELNRQLEKRNPSTPSIDELLHPQPPQRSCPGLLNRSPFNEQLEAIYARQISEGHGFRDHGYQFGSPGRPCTKSEYRDKILRVMRYPNVEIKQLKNGQTLYYQEATNTLVVVNPRDRPDYGTMYRPDRGRVYFDEQE